MTNCLSVSDYFLGLTIKELISYSFSSFSECLSKTNQNLKTDNNSNDNNDINKDNSNINKITLMYDISFLLTHFFPMHTFSTPWKHQKTWRFFDILKG